MNQSYCFGVCAVRAVVSCDKKIHPFCRAVQIGLKVVVLLVALLRGEILSTITGIYVSSTGGVE
jgi:hypothetical protein